MRASQPLGAQAAKAPKGHALANLLPSAQVSRGRLEALELQDAEKREAAAAKNDLEAYIIATRGAVEGDEALSQVRGRPFLPWAPEGFWVG